MSDFLLNLLFVQDPPLGSVQQLYALQRDVDKTALKQSKLIGDYIFLPAKKLTV